jgi:protein-tyrosine-phosphatase
LTEDKAREEDHARNLLFICTANVCRSPMAEAIFNALAEEKGLGWQATSAGVAALEGEDITPNARAALEEVGIYPAGHSARQVSEGMIEEADLVLVMSPRHIRRYAEALEASRVRSISCPATQQI